MDPPPGPIYTLNAGIEALHGRGDLRLYDAKYADFECNKEELPGQPPYCYKRPNGSVDLYEEVDSSWFHRCRPWKGAIRKALLTVAVVVYALIGGAVFSHVERREEEAQIANVDRWRNDTAIALATELRQVNQHDEDWAKTVFKYLGAFERDLMRVFQKGYRQVSDPVRGHHWSFGASLAFSISAMTGTVYGTMSPRSPAGRVLFPIYAVLGIPLTFFWLLVTGGILADAWTFLVLRLCCCLTRPSTPRKVCPLHNQDHALQQQQQQQQQQQNQQRPRSSSTVGKPTRTNSLPRCPATAPSRQRCPVEFLVPSVEYQAVIVVFAILVFIVYFVVGTAVISLSTEWTFSESLSFTVLMLTTRGIGDFEPGLGESLGFAMALKQDMFMVGYYVLGMCFLSTIASLMYRAVTFKRRRAASCRNYAC